MQFGSYLKLRLCKIYILSFCAKSSHITKYILKQVSTLLNDILDSLFKPNVQFLPTGLARMHFQKSFQLRVTLQGRRFTNLLKNRLNLVLFPRIWLENLGLHTCCASDLTSTYPSYQRGIWGWNYPQLFKFATFCYVKVILYNPISYFLSLHLVRCFYDLVYLETICPILFDMIIIDPCNIMMTESEEIVNGLSKVSSDPFSC